MFSKAEIEEFLNRPTFLAIIILVMIVSIFKLLHLTTTDTLITFMFYVGIAASLNIIMGFAGYVSFGHSVFLGIGGYAYSLIVYYIIGLARLQNWGMGIPILFISVLSGIFAAVIAGGVGYAVLKLRGAFLL